MRETCQIIRRVHEELESHWSRKIGTYFDEKNLLNSLASDNAILKESEARDTKFGITFNNVVPKLYSKDIWEETVLICRSSFTIASIIAPYQQYDYKPNDNNLAPFNTLFAQNQKLLDDLDKTVMHDSILSVAIVWKDIWMKFH